jgi:glycosyltransferase involved in cell wall biosynthesis
MSNVAFVTTFCPHHRQKTFETLAKYYDVTFYFFSAGDEWYWQRQHGVKSGNFNHEYLWGIRLGGTRITPTLFTKLWRGSHDVYIKCINGRLALPVTYLIARLRRKPFILWTGIWMRLQTPVHRLIFPFTRYVYRHSDAIVVYGEHVKRYLISEGVLPERIFVTTHAVDNDLHNRFVGEDEKTALRQKLNIAPNQKIILYLGRLETVKGLVFLLEAFVSIKNKDTVLIFAGSGSELQNLKEYAGKLGISDRTRFAGYVQSDETTKYYALAWVYVLPSITTKDSKEPWGLVINEAFNQGVPVIATNAVGAAAGGLVQDGMNGFVVPERDSPSLAAVLQKIVDDDALRQKMSGYALRTIAGWNNERMVAGFRKSIDYVLKYKR